jgi:acetate kinase
LRQSHGASVSAVRHGLCVNTSMGFTPLAGLMMGTRSGSIASGILMYPLRQNGLDADQLDHTLNDASGLLGVSGTSSDMRQVLAADVAVPASTSRILVIATREDMTIVREIQRLLSRS